MFKVGDEVFVPVKILEYDRIYNDYKVEFANGALGRYDDSFLNDVHGKTYTQGLADAWELARKISLAKYGYTNEQIKEIFGVFFAYEALSNFTAEEALAKIEAYEREKEIKPMDVVEHIGKEWIVSQVNDSEYLLWDGRNVIHVEKGTVKKVGSIGSLEQLTKLLRQIGE